MLIREFDRENAADKAELQRLLAACFPHCYGESASDEAGECLSGERIALAAFAEGRLCGFIGAMPRYGVTGWELHPLAVFPECQGRGVGTALVRALEEEVRKRGGVTLYLGTDDEFGQTSLAGADLYDSLWERIANIRNLHRHPYEFYQKLGFAIVGVLPDVNGPGKPDIHMAKRIGGTA